MVRRSGFPPILVHLAEDLFPEIEEGKRKAVLDMARRKVHGTATSSAGRLFDAFSALLGAVVFESVAVPIRLSDLRAPAIYQQIRQEPGDSTVLELPLGWRNGFRVTGALHNMIMYEQFYQTTSQKRMLGGNTSRNPEFGPAGGTPGGPDRPAGIRTGAGER